MSSLVGFLIIAIILFIPTYAIWNTIQHNKARRMQIEDLKARKRERREGRP
jgi:hypothetical protein